MAMKMSDNKLQKNIAAVLLCTQLAMLPAFVFASATPVSTADSGSTIENGAFNIQLKLITTVNPTQPTNALLVCDTAMQAFEKTDNAVSMGLSFSSIIGGGDKLAAQYALEISAYNIYLGCLQGDTTLGFVPGVLPALTNLTAPNIYTAGIKQQYIEKVNANIVIYKAKLASAKAHYSVASQNIWKALLITILLNTTKAVASQLVAKLVNNYKISNIKAYTDSVATLMYDNQFIRDNYPSNQDQLMARAILNNPAFRTQVPPGLFVQADAALGYTSLNPDDPNFYSNLAKAGFASTNPYYLHTSYVAGTDQAHSLALATAQTHIVQGNGYKAPVNCAGSLAQQKQIDTQSKAASDALAYAQGQLSSLQKAQQLDANSVSAADLAKAQAAYQTALTTWNNLPFAVTGKNDVSNSGIQGGNNTEGTAAIIMCEAVSSPAVLVNQGIDAVFKSLNLGQYNNSNLPGFLSAISGIATQIGSNLVLGGITGNSARINENAILNQAVSATQAATIQTLDNNAVDNMAKGVQFQAYSNSTKNGATLAWNIITQQISTASYVTIAGPAITGALVKLPLSGSKDIVLTTVGNYTLTVYDATNKVLISALISVDPSQLAFNNTGVPAVAGAFTGRQPVLARGELPSLSPRGVKY